MTEPFYIVNCNKIVGLTFIVILIHFIKTAYVHLQILRMRHPDGAMKEGSIFI